jgi:hypothetical protein
MMASESGACGQARRSVARKGLLPSQLEQGVRANRGSGIDGLRLVAAQSRIMTELTFVDADRLLRCRLRRSASV